MRTQGFTLIELIVVILLLSILAVTALPKYINLSDEAKASVVAGLAAELTTQSKLNFLGYQLSGQFSFGTSAPATSSKVIATTVSGSSSPGACATLLGGVSGFNNVKISSTTGLTPLSDSYAIQLPGGISIVNDTSCTIGGASIGQTASCVLQNSNSPYISAVAYVLCTN